jgi:hypothetical protein
VMQPRLLSETLGLCAGAIGITVMPCAFGEGSTRAVVELSNTWSPDVRLRADSR